MSKELMDIVLPRLAQRLNRQLRRYRAGELDDVLARSRSRSSYLARDVTCLEARTVKR